MMNILEKKPALDAWEGLYRAAVAFRNLKPWEWMWEQDVFGVRNPLNGEIGYCIVTGALGEHFSLGVYLGDRGLDGYQKMAYGDLEPFDAVLSQDCLMASFEGRDCLDPEDLQVIKELGLRFRGPASWPLFRRYEPGYLPWFLNEREAGFLSLALEQAREVALRCRKNPQSLVPQEAKGILVRTPHPHGNRHSWHDEWVQPVPLPPKTATNGSFNEVRAQKIKKLNLKPKGFWEAGFFSAPIPIEEGDVKPFYPYVLLIVEHQSGMVLGLDVRHHSRYQKEFRDLLLNTVERSNSLPREIRVLSEEALQLLQPVAGRMNVKVRQYKRLSRLEQARESILETIF